MISRINKLPDWDKPSAEMIKIQNYFEAYSGDCKLFMQRETGAVISLLDSDTIICGNIETVEVKKFLEFSNVNSVFSSSDNLEKLFGGFNEVSVLINEKPTKSSTNNTFFEQLNSREAFDILSSGGFDLPEYEFFATDYCRRLNHGKIKVFSKNKECIAITLETEKYRMIGGITTKQKGLGGALLLAAVSGDKPVLAVCRDELLPFYSKFGFRPLYKAGYWGKYN